MPKVSIIVPFINGEEHIEKCIKNLKKQKYKDYEIILIDDGSTDLSKQIINKFLQENNIKYYYIKKDTIGVGKARNYGIEKAQGEYIMFVDVDDLIEENLLTKLQPYIEQQIDLIKYKMMIVNKDEIKKAGGPVFEKINGEESFNKLCYKDKYLDSPCLYLIRKEFFINLNLKFTENVYHEDFGLIPQLIVNAKSVVSVNLYGYYYIQTEKSIMRDYDYNKTIKKVSDKFKLYDNMIKNLENFNIRKETKEQIKTYYTNSIIVSLKELKKQDRKEFSKKLKNKKLLRNIKIKNLKQLVKKILLVTNINLYFKLKQGE